MSCHNANVYFGRVMERENLNTWLHAVNVGQ